MFVFIVGNDKYLSRLVTCNIFRLSVKWNGKFYLNANQVVKKGEGVLGFPPPPELKKL